MTDRDPAPRPRPDDGLLDLAAPYAMDAMEDDERRAIEAALRRASPDVRRDFVEHVRVYSEALAAYSHTTAQAPPPHLMQRVMGAVAAEDHGTNVGLYSPTLGRTGPDGPFMPEMSHRGRRIAEICGAVAAAALLLAGGMAIGNRFSTDTPDEPESSEMLAADDVRTATLDLAGGTATVLFSHEADTAVLVMNDVSPPDPDTIYQLWLMGPDSPPTSVGTMARDEVTPSTQAVVDGIASAETLGISIEPAGGSAEPSAMVADISLA